MKVTPIKTRRVTADDKSLTDLLDEFLPKLSNGSIVAITSKIVSLCEQRTVLLEDTDKETLMHRESDRYVKAAGEYGFHFTITKNTLIPSAGIDESNADGHYVLWPADPQATANDIRRYLKKRDGLSQLGVIITDSTCTPLRAGTVGICLAHSGFSALNDYVGQPDLFGRPYSVSQANIAGGLASAAVLTMGEGAEQTPLCLIEDTTFVQFEDQDPTAEELKLTYITPDIDIFAPFIAAVDWQKGENGASHD